MFDYSSPDVIYNNLNKLFADTPDHIKSFEKLYNPNNFIIPAGNLGACLLRSETDVVKYFLVFGLPGSEPVMTNR
jgi:hypothetical protein